MWNKAHSRCLGSGSAAAMALRAACRGILNIIQDNTYPASHNKPQQFATWCSASHYNRAGGVYSGKCSTAYCRMRDEDFQGSLGAGPGIRARGDTQVLPNFLFAFYSLRIEPSFGGGGFYPQR